MSLTPDRSAMVTGAGRGIGRAIALRLAQDGFAVTVTDLESARDAALGVVDEVVRSGGTARYAATNVSLAGDVEAAVAGNVQAYGALDVLVANAGIAITAPLVETTRAVAANDGGQPDGSVPLLPSRRPADDRPRQG